MGHTIEQAADHPRMQPVRVGAKALPAICGRSHRACVAAGMVECSVLDSLLTNRAATSSGSNLVVAVPVSAEWITDAWTPETTGRSVGGGRWESFGDWGQVEVAAAELHRPSRQRRLQLPALDELLKRHPPQEGVKAPQTRPCNACSRSRSAWGTSPARVAAKTIPSWSTASGGRVHLSRSAPSRLTRTAPSGQRSALA